MRAEGLAVPVGLSAVLRAEIWELDAAIISSRPLSLRVTPPSSLPEESSGEMAPRNGPCILCLRAARQRPQAHRLRAREASAQAISPAPTHSQTTSSPPPILRHERDRPPTHRPPEFRRSQLHRQYTSLLQASPLMLLFQHSNLRAVEWMALRRELAHALRQVDEQEQQQQQQQQQAAAPSPNAPPRAAPLSLADSVKLQVVRGRVFDAALRVTEFYAPPPPPAAPAHPTSPSSPSSAALPPHALAARPAPAHQLSRAAHAAAAVHKGRHALAALVAAGPLAALSFPAVSPAHVRAALTVLAPKAPAFPAPRRKARPGYHEPAVQMGVAKLMLLGARVEGRALDGEGVRWVGGIEGGMDGLRARLVATLQGAGGGVVQALEGAGRALWLVMEGRRGMLEEEEKGGKEGEAQSGKEDGEKE